MPTVTITITDLPGGEIAISSDFKPQIGNPCTPAQGAALEIINRTRREWGLTGSQRLAQALLDPEDLGHQATREIRDRARASMAMPPVETTL